MSRPISFLLIVVLCVIWGSTWPIIKIGFDALPPFLSAGSRFLVSGIVLFGLSWLQGVRLPRSGRAHLGLLGHGIVGIGLSYGVVYWGEQYIPAGLSAVLFATNPLFVLLLAHFVLASEPITLRKLLGVTLGFVGVLFIFKDELQLPDRMSEVAAAVTLVSPFVAAISVVGIKRWGQHLHPYNLTALPMTYAAGALLVVSVLTEDLSTVRWTGTAIGNGVVSSSVWVRCRVCNLLHPLETVRGQHSSIHHLRFSCGGHRSGLHTTRRDNRTAVTYWHRNHYGWNCCGHETGSRRSGTNC